MARAPFISEKPRMRALHWTKVGLVSLTNGKKNMSEVFGLDTIIGEKKIN